ncbi:MAG: hypothetical protein ACUBOA_06035 [Candidatus Loosdrechtia sp.]|uniref:hypothetical protein n=1 Tax=Candidatus Loosdrechtia sp. TaxID=3101272 RepID=UPI003A73E783|nr:MAG: hypothetical protein QY305_09235 [Candidatus Jettenia sp. AMX2]
MAKPQPKRLTTKGTKKRLWFKGYICHLSACGHLLAALRRRHGAQAGGWTWMSTDKVRGLNVSGSASDF